MTDLTEGQPAPAFDLPTDGGANVSNDTLKGRTVVLFFYPKADTPACTNEARNFTDLSADFASAGAVVIGISKDPVRKLQRFKAKHELNIQLASDETAGVTETFDLWALKSMYGKTYMGIERATILIDGDGIIRRVWRKVSVKGHAAEVLDAVKAL